MGNILVWIMVAVVAGAFIVGFIMENVGLKKDKKDESAAGKDIACTSFVSDKNKEVTSVLFVLQTPKIEKEEVETVEVSKETKQTMLDKGLSSKVCKFF